MIGMFPPGPDGTVRADSTGRWAMMADQARQASAAEISVEDAHRTFYRLPVRQRLVIMLGGPFMNLFLAFALFTIVLCGIGTTVLTASISAVVPCIPTVAAPAGDLALGGVCPTGSVSSPAVQAGLITGETITAVAGKSVSDWVSTAAAIKAAGTGPTPFGVTAADGSTRNVTVHLIGAPRPVYDAQGNPTGTTEVRPFLGIAPGTALERQPLTAVPAAMWDMTTRSVQAMLSLPVRVYELGRDTVSGAGRSPDSPVSVVGVTRLGGDVAASAEPFAAKTATVLALAASLNLFLFLFNLLPILPLDGGHVAGALWEALRRRLATLRGAPDPGPVDVARAMPIAYGVTAVLLAMSVVVIYADVVNPIKLF